MPNGRGLLLDLDGTLADSLGLLWTVYRRFLLRYGREASSAEFERLNGVPTIGVVAALAETHDLPGDAAELVGEYRALITDGYLEATAHAGADTLLRAARRLGWSVAVVTSNDSGLARRWLTQVGLGEMVDVVVGGDMVRRGKPDPEPYTTALAGLGAAAASSVAVEDSALGVASARAAGVQTFLFRPAAAGSIPASVEPTEIPVLNRLDDLLPHLG